MVVGDFSERIFEYMFIWVLVIVSVVFIIVFVIVKCGLYVLGYVSCFGRFNSRMILEDCICILIVCFVRNFGVLNENFWNLCYVMVI